ncbi:MAG: anthrone oxygenase family protein [Pseudomonadota bacterium]|nr:anthrone oxygenase family protein [Pseudomonadota bacterium]
MSEVFDWPDLLVRVSVIGFALAGGIYFVFSVFSMPALARIDASAAIQAMQSINRVIVRTAFLPLFFGTTVLGVLLAAGAVSGWFEGSRTLLVLAGTIYVAGMFGVTVAFNVPLNNRLDAVVAGSPEAAGVWTHYLARWTVWNHVRTVACCVASALALAGLAQA